MSQMSTYLEGKFIDHLFRTTSYTRPATIYIALFDTTASLANLEAGTLTGEISGGSYSRVAFGPADANWNAATDGVTSNASAITFTQATASWGTVRYVAIMDASTAGNVLLYGQLSADRTVSSGDTFQINAGDATITFQ